MTLSLAKAIYGNAREEDAGYGVTRVLIRKGGVEVVFQPKGEHVMDVLAWLLKTGRACVLVDSVDVLIIDQAAECILHDGTPEDIAEAVYHAALEVLAND